MLSSSVSTDHIGRKCSTTGYLRHLMRCEKSRTNGYKATTKNDPMRRWEACPRLCSVSDCSHGRTLLLNCLLDGGAYDYTRESIVIEVDTSISGDRVARVLDRIAGHRPLP